MARYLMAAAILLMAAPVLAQQGVGAEPAANHVPCSSSAAINCIELHELQGAAILDLEGEAMAVGGPYEPVTEANILEFGHDQLMEHRATVNAGMGGPIEARSSYPACRPGPGDDECIQLYEPGVTGAGN